MSTLPRTADTCSIRFLEPKVTNLEAFFLRWLSLASERIMMFVVRISMWCHSPSQHEASYSMRARMREPVRMRWILSGCAATAGQSLSYWSQSHSVIWLGLYNIGIKSTTLSGVVSHCSLNVNDDDSRFSGNCFILSRTQDLYFVGTGSGAENR